MWKSVGPLRDPNQIENPSQSRNAGQSKSPQLLGRLDIEITLLKKLPKQAESSILSKSTRLNELSLTDDAFLPKTYTLRIERGNFSEPCYIGYPGAEKPRFALRLIFDNSPYPPRSEWKNPENGPDDSQFWNHTEFVSRPSPELAEHRSPMSIAIEREWGDCIVT